MNMKYLEIVPLEISIESNSYVRKCKINWIDDEIQIDQKELYYQFDQSIEPPQWDDCDSYLVAVIMTAMQEAREVKVRGKVSKQLLSNLVEYQAVWARWVPETYGCVNVSVDVFKQDCVLVPGAVCAFSGGVDSTFSVWRHSQGKCSYRSQKINLCSIVHGFDIPLSNETEFNNASAAAKSTLADIGLKRINIKTNFREVLDATNWEYSFACALVAALNNLKSAGSTCIIGSSDPYDKLFLPWGSSPITDHLLSSEDFIVLHDGATHSRTEKVGEIATWKYATQNLRVCWQGELKDRNCGKCEKCIRTKLNFLATGNPIPSCFPNSDIFEDLKGIVLTSSASRAEWQPIYEYAKKHGITELWVQELPEIIKPKIIETEIIQKKPVIDYLLPKGSKRRKLVKRLIRRD